MDPAQSRLLHLQYESLTGPRFVEIVPIKQMGRVRWHVSANDDALEMAGSFFDEPDAAKAAVEARLRKRYGDAVALSWRSA